MLRQNLVSWLQICLFAMHWLLHLLPNVSVTPFTAWDMYHVVTQSNSSSGSSSNNKINVNGSVQDSSNDLDWSIGADAA